MREGANKMTRWPFTTNQHQAGLPTGQWARRGCAVPAPFQSQRCLLKRQAPRRVRAPRGTAQWPPPVTVASLCSRPRLQAAADLSGLAESPGGMGGEAGSAAALGSEGRVKSLGLVFEDESKGCYSSGEIVAGHVLLEAAEPVALRALRLEAHGRATAAWGPSAGAAAPASAAEVEYLNVRLRLREPPAGELSEDRGVPTGPRAAPGRAGEGALADVHVPGVPGGLLGVGSSLGVVCASLVASDAHVAIPVPPAPPPHSTWEMV